MAKKKVTLKKVKPPAKAVKKVAKSSKPVAKAAAKKAAPAKGGKKSAAPAPAKKPAEPETPSLGRPLVTQEEKLYMALCRCPFRKKWRANLDKPRPHFPW